MPVGCGSLINYLLCEAFCRVITSVRLFVEFIAYVRPFVEFIASVRLFVEFIAFVRLFVEFIASVGLSPVGVYISVYPIGVVVAWTFLNKVFVKEVCLAHGAIGALLLLLPLHLGGLQDISSKTLCCP